MQEYSYYNFDGDVIDTIYYSIEGNIFTVKDKNGRKASRKIKEESGWCYKFMKTIVKAEDGPEGLKRFIERTSRPGSVMNSAFFGVLERVLNT